MINKKTLVVDCNYLCHRAIHTMGTLSFEDHNTDVIFGFLKQILSYAKIHKTNDIIFCWDSVNSKRKKLYSKYKANRHKKDLTPEEIELKKDGYKQFNELKTRVLPLMGFKNIYSQDGYEADDLIATTVMYHEKDFILITSDHDMYQLLDFTDMWNPSSKKLYTYNNFFNEWGVNPYDWIEIKSLAGCSSDNIEGIQGVGEKTAAKYIKEKLKTSSKIYRKIKKEEEIILKTNVPLVQLPFPGTKVYKIFNNKLDFDNFIQNVCYWYSFDSFLTGDYLLKWQNFFKGKF